MVHYAHMFNYVCEDFLHRYFPRLLLGIFEFWIEETFAREVIHDRAVTYSHTPTEYDIQVQVVIARARVLGRGFMSLSRQLFCPVNEFNLLHLGGHYPRLREMFPRYYEQTRGVKVQMFLTFWHYTHIDYSIEFYIHMTVFGGMAGGAVGVPAVDHATLLAAPDGNHSWSLLKVQSPLPPRILYTNQTPLTSDVAILAEWMEVVAREPLSDNDRIEHYAGFEQRDFIVLPADGELDYDMHDTPLHTEAVEPTVSAHPFTHPIFRAIIAVKKWRRAPLVKACLESPPTSMTANFQDALLLYKVVHRSDPPPTEARPYADAAARFDAEVLHQLQRQGQIPFSLLQSFVDLVAQEEQDLCTAASLSPTPLQHQPTPNLSAPGHSQGPLQPLLGSAPLASSATASSRLPATNTRVSFESVVGGGAQAPRLRPHRGPPHRSGDRFPAPGWEHLPHDCDEDHSYSDRSGSGSDPEQGITAP
ncbi:hypothetical protein B484DRAFT_471709 [Ochromonadaceae sp. CCMP2298]|nr:hypothetical protein B484DRAFT_471709 [Ochromonadaceae sp. CCMP2298]